MPLTMDELLNLTLRELLEMADTTHPVLIRARSDDGTHRSLLLVEGPEGCQKLEAVASFVTNDSGPLQSN